MYVMFPGAAVLDAAEVEGRAPPRAAEVAAATVTREDLPSEGGRIPLETLIELKFFNSSFSSFNIIESRQIILYQAIRANSISSNSILPPSYPCGSWARQRRWAAGGPVSLPRKGNIRDSST